MNKSIKEYLPSKKFIISISVLLGIALLFFGIKTLARSTKKTVDPSQVVIKNLVNPAEIDTDQDGLYDWEEALWGTDPQNPDSDADGIPDGVAIERKKTEAGITESTELSDTDLFAKDLYTTIAVAAQDGLTEEESLALQNDIAKAIVNKTPSEPTYTLESLIVVPFSNQSYNSYVSKIMGAFVYNEEIKQRLQTTTSQIKNSTIDSVFFKTTGDEFIAFAQELAKVPTPNTSASTHLLFVNAFDRLGKILSGLSQIENDPIYAFSYGIEYHEAIANLSSAYANLGSYFSSMSQ